MEIQKIFDKVAKHLLKQKAKSIDVSRGDHLCCRRKCEMIITGFLPTDEHVDCLVFE